MELAYRDDAYIDKILDHKNPFPSLYLDRQEYKMMHNELAPFWKMKKAYHTASGWMLSYLRPRAISLISKMERCICWLYVEQD